MIHRALIFLLIALLTSLTSAAALAPASLSAQAAHCSSKVGTVLGYDPTASHSCSGDTLVAQPLYAGETVQSNGTGNFTFQIGHLPECIQFAAPKGTGDVLRPRPGIVIRHLRGTTWCKHDKSDTQTRTLKTPGAIIRLHGTTFGIQSNGKRSTIKVTGGNLTAISTFSGRFVTISGGHQASFPVHGSPSQPQRLKRSATDAKAINLLSVGAAPMGIPEIFQSLQNQGTKSTILVALDSSTLNAVGPQLSKEGITFHALLDSQLKSNPNALNTFGTKLRTQTVVVATPAADARPALDDVHNAAPSFSIIFYDTTP
jgi:hypothetical protein